MNICGYKGDYKLKAIELLKEVGIPEEKHTHLAHNLSGGEQQRIAIARTIASNAEIILADEPTGNLDQTNQDNIMSIFQNLTRKYDKCVVIVTHSKAVADSADLTLQISAGKIKCISLST